MDKDDIEKLLSYISSDCYDDYDFLELLADICYNYRIHPDEVLPISIVEHVLDLIGNKIKEYYAW